MTAINKYGLLNALLNVMNSNEEESAKVVIAKYLLENFKNIDKINIYDAAEACSVSRASIRRFSQDVGFDNFKNLKKDKLNYEFYSNEGIENYETYIAQEINEMVKTCSSSLHEIKREIAESMDTADEILFLVSDIYTSRCMEFQKEMILQGKMVRILSSNFDNNKLLERLSNQTLSFIISTSGGFLKKTEELLQRLPGTKVVMTASSFADVNETFDFIIRIGDGSIPQKKSVYHTIAIEYYLEILVNEYKLIMQ